MRREIVLLSLFAEHAFTQMFPDEGERIAEAAIKSFEEVTASKYSALDSDWLVQGPALAVLTPCFGDAAIGPRARGSRQCRETRLALVCPKGGRLCPIRCVEAVLDCRCLSGPNRSRWL